MMMDDFEKAKRLERLLFILRHIHMPHEQMSQKFRIRDMMVLDVILKAIAHQADGLVKMSDLSIYFHITPAATSQMVREYEGKGWIEREILDRDRRSVYLKVTDQAIALLKENEQCLMRGMMDFIAYLGEDDSDALIRILEKATAYRPITAQSTEGKE